MAGPREEPLVPRPIALLGIVAVIGLAVFAYLQIAGDDEGEGGKEMPEPITVEATKSPPLPTDEDVAPEPADPGPQDVFSSARFAPALAAARVIAGPRARMTRLQLNGPFADFHLLKRGKLRGIRWNALSAAVEPIEVITVGGGSPKAIAFKLGAVKTAAIDRLVRRTARKSGRPDFEVISLDLRRDPVDNRLRWEIVGHGGGELGLIYYADPDGTGVRSQQQQIARTTPVPPPTSRKAAKQLRCIQRKIGSSRIRVCFKR